MIKKITPINNMYYQQETKSNHYNGIINHGLLSDNRYVNIKKNIIDKNEKKKERK